MNDSVGIHKNQVQPREKSYTSTELGIDKIPNKAVTFVLNREVVYSVLCLKGGCLNI